jgi:hypothetical protein
VKTLAQLAVLLIAIALFVAYMRGGWPGVRHWWRAKLVGGT